MVYYLQSRGDNINGEYTNGGKWSAGTPLATQKGVNKMYLILLNNRLWYEADTFDEVKNFIKVMKRTSTQVARVMKCYEKGVWKELKIGE